MCEVVVAANETDRTGDYLKKTLETLCKIKNSESKHNKRVVSDCLSVGKPKVVEMCYTGANSIQHPKKGHTNRFYC